MKKYYAKEYESNYSFDTDYYVCFEDETNFGLIVDGNDDYQTYTTKEYDNIKNYSYEILCTINNDAPLTERLNELMPKSNGKGYSKQEVHKIKEIFLKNQKNDSLYHTDHMIIDLLTIITGKEYGYREIHGCVQREWQMVYYPVKEYSTSKIDYIESVYFGIGKEYIVDEEPHDKKIEPSDINGNFMFVPSYLDAKEEIAKELGCSTADVVLYDIYDMCE